VKERGSRIRSRDTPKFNGVRLWKGVPPATPKIKGVGSGDLKGLATCLRKLERGV
jgi:hypothetical protein